MKLVGYARVSTEEQAEEGHSLEAQHEAIVRWAKAMGHDVREVVGDRGVSGSVAPVDRPAFRSALEAMDGCGFDGIVAVALDRFSRSTKDVLELIERARKRGWKVISLREPLDVETAIGRLFVTFLAGLAQFERELIGERTAAGLGVLRRAGKRFSGAPPWGYRFVDGRLEDDLVEQNIRDYVRELPLATAAALAVHLNNRWGQHPRLRRPWDRGMVNNLRRAIRPRGRA